MSTNCNTGISIPALETDPCSGNVTSTDCVASPNANITLDLPSGATQTETNAALTAALIYKEQQIQAIDGSETIVEAGTNVSVTGTGTILNPYIVTSTDTIADGSETKVIAGENINITGTGTISTPYVIDSPKNIDNNFFIATQLASSKLIYLTDTYREIDLQLHTSIVITNSNEIILNNNDLYVGGNFSEDNSLPAYILKIVNCKIYNNELIFDYLEAIEVGLPIHSLILYNNFLFSCSRTVTTEITKINPYDFSDVRTLVLPNTADFNGQTTDIIGYNNKLYVLVTTNYYQTSKFVEITEDLLQYTKLFSITSVAGFLTAPSSPFIIYKDEVFIPFIINSTHISIRVYDLQGTVKRTGSNILINSTGASTAIPHWMAIFNNKLIISTAYGKSLVRLDCLTLGAEESIALNVSVTDDNTITKEGYVYLNGEKNPFDPTVLVELYKIKYNNFTEKTTEIANYNSGNGSYGSINSRTY